MVLSVAFAGCMPLVALAAASPFGITPTSPSVLTSPPASMQPMGGPTNPPFGDIPQSDMAPGGGASLSGGNEGGECGQYLKRSKSARTAREYQTYRNAWQQCTTKKCAASGGAGKAGQCPKDPDCESFCTESASGQGALLSCCSMGPQEKPSCKKMIDNKCADKTGRAMGKSDQDGGGGAQTGKQEPSQQQGQQGGQPQMPQMPQGGGGQGGGQGQSSQSAQEQCALKIAMGGTPDPACSTQVSARLSAETASRVDASGAISALAGPDTANASGQQASNAGAHPERTLGGVFSGLTSWLSGSAPTDASPATETSVSGTLSTNTFTAPTTEERRAPVASNAWSRFLQSVSSAWNNLLGH